MTNFQETRALFQLPADVIYLDGNSLGPLPKAAPQRMAEVMQEEWGGDLIRAWNSRGWMSWPDRLGDRIGALIGAAGGSVAIGDTLSIKVFQAVSSALDMNPDRRVILSDSGNFPTDLYMADGLSRLKGAGHEVRVVAPEAVADALDDSIAVLMLTEVDYRTGRRHDMAEMTRIAHQHGVITVWDLAHSAGAFPVDLAGAGADFAVGCTYKYLNAGPGAPAFIYVAPAHQASVAPALSGWLGHEAPFAFDRDYRPADGVRRMRVGTPPILAMAALEAALDVWDGVSLADIRTGSEALMAAFIDTVATVCPTLELASPRDVAQRGSQVSFRHPEGYAIMQALIDHKIIGDFRAPDIIRFGFTPLYLSISEVVRAAETLGDIVNNAVWDQDKYKIRSAVT